MKSNIVIIDYGMGNIHSVKKKLMNLNAEVLVSSNPADVVRADKIILPGVGHFAKAMTSLKSLGLVDVLNEQVLNHKKPLLGICLGMQLLAKNSEEGDAEGLGWIDADVVRFSVKDTLKHKVPHTGWNEIIISKESRLMKDVPNLSELYFVHSYHLNAHSKDDVLNETDFEYRFVSAVEKENIFGVQYHPEKSHEVGEQILKNFINL